uniref:Aspartylglucosaminidase n=1 Tax=Romanomermis culicivorax TaxID=13658 RepID=A0A915JE61_ROMCU
WLTFKRSGSRLQAIVEGCSYCEEVQCDGSIGFGGSPDEKGRVTLDAILIDGPKHKIGGVAQLSKIKSAIQVAWAVMNFTKHTLIVGDQADNFAVEMGFEESKLETVASEKIYRKWQSVNCQPNFRQNVIPDPEKQCGPYTPSVVQLNGQSSTLNSGHDTVGMLIVDENGDLSAGTSTNGASHKIPG